MRAVFYFGVGFITAVAAEFNQGGRISILGVSEYLGEGVDPLRTRKPTPLFWCSDPICDSATPLEILDFIGV